MDCCGGRGFDILDSEYNLTYCTAQSTAAFCVYIGWKHGRNICESFTRYFTRLRDVITVRASIREGLLEEKESYTV